MLSLLLALVITPPSHALENVNQPFTVDCTGSAGSVHFSQSSEGLTYAVDVPPTHYAGFVHPYLEKGLNWEEGSAALLDPSPGTNWLSVTATHGVKRWSPPFEGCMPSRNPNAPCIPMHNDGSYSNIPTQWLSVMVNVSDKQNPVYMGLDLGGQNDSLGSGATCTVTGL